MGKKRTTRGLSLRGEIWHIKKVICGRLVCESTGTGDFAEAERYLALRMEEARKTSIYGQRKKHTLDEAAARFLIENRHQRGITRQGFALRHLVEWFGDMPLDRIYGETITPYVDARLAGRIGRKVVAGTLMRELAALKAVLRKAASVWRDDNGLTWLERAPDVPSITVDARQPRPINWAEQEALFKALPGYMARMAMFAVNTGCRDQEVCGLRWEWEHEADGRSVFVLPGNVTKNGEEKLVPLNSIAQSVVDSERGKSPEWVFTLKGVRLSRMNNRAWRSARMSAAIDARVHDLRHTFAMRLRDGGIPQEDIQDLLGHKKKTVTHHYSRATVDRLFRCVDVLADPARRPSVVLRRVQKVA